MTEADRSYDQVAISRDGLDALTNFPLSSYDTSALMSTNANTLVEKLRSDAQQHQLGFRQLDGKARIAPGRHVRRRATRTTTHADKCTHVADLEVAAAVTLLQMLETVRTTSGGRWVP